MPTYTRTVIDLSLPENDPNRVTVVEMTEEELLAMIGAEPPVEE